MPLPGQPHCSTRFWKGATFSRPAAGLKFQVLRLGFADVLTWLRRLRGGFADGDLASRSASCFAIASQMLATSR